MYSTQQQDDDAHPEKHFGKCFSFKKFCWNNNSMLRWWCPAAGALRVSPWSMFVTWKFRFAIYGYLEFEFFERKCSSMQILFITGKSLVCWEAFEWRKTCWNSCLVSNFEIISFDSSSFSYATNLSFRLLQFIFVSDKLTFPDRLNSETWWSFNKKASSNKTKLLGKVLPSKKSRHIFFLASSNWVQLLKRMMSSESYPGLMSMQSAAHLLHFIPKSL